MATIPSDSNMTRTLLACSAVAGPLYMFVSFSQAFTRAGFDLTRHALSLLTNGDLGWLQVANFIITGLLITSGAVGMRRTLRAGRGAVWGPLLIGVFGSSFVGAGLFKPDPALGFPVGTPTDAMTISTNGIIHFAMGGIGFLALIAACLVFARRFGALQNRKWSIFSMVTGILFLLAFAALSSGAGKSWTFIAFLMGVSLAWLWLTLLSMRLRAEV